MAISFANVIKATGNGVTSVTTSGVTTTTGSTFVIACSFGSSPYWSTPSSFTDNKGNTYTRTGVQAASGCSIELAHCINGTGGAGHTATVSGSTGDYPVVYFLELTGVAASGYDSGAHVKTTDTSSPYTVTSNALAQADSAILVLSTSFEGGTVNQTISSGYTVVKEDDYSNFFGSAFGYKTVSSASAETATVGGVAADTAMGIYAFKAAAAGSEDFEANQTAAVTTQAATVTNDTPLWTPTQLTNDMVWYVADNSANTITGGFLTTLADKGGTNKPASVKNGTTNLRAEIDNTLNGRVVWESKSGGSNLGHLRSGATGITRNTGQVTIFSLVRPSSSGIVALTDVGDGYFARASLYMSSGTELHCSGRRLNADTLSDIAETGLTSGTWGLFTGKYDYTNSDMTLRRNGAVTASTTSFQTNGVTADNDSLYVSLGHYSNPSGDTTELPLDGLHAEHIIIKGALSDDDIERVEGYIAWDWGVSASLDASHPYKSAPPLTAGASITANQTAAATTQTATVAARGAVVATQTAAATTQTATVVVGGKLSTTSGDTHAASVSLLLNCNGVQGSTTFPDSSPSPKTVTVVGAAQVTTSFAKWGTGGLNPNGGRLTVPHSTSLDLSVGDWTIECWFYLVTPTTVAVLLDKETNNGQYPFSLLANSPTSTKLGMLRFNSGGSLMTNMVGTTTITAGVWHHAAASRSGDNFYLFLDGNLETSRTDAGAVLRSAADPVNIGNNGINSAGAVFMDDIRITKGVARYTASFALPGYEFVPSQMAAPTTQVATISASAYLINMLFDTGNGSTSFVDTGSGAQTWSATNGAVCSTAQVLDGVSSLSVPATNAYLASGAATASSRLPATGDFAIEFMARASNWASAYLLSLQDAGATAAGTQFALVTDASGHIQIILSDGITRGIWFTSAAILATNTDLTIRFARSGGSISLHVNGAQLTNNNYAGSLPAVTSAWRIGAAANGTPAPTGYYFDRLTVLAGSEAPASNIPGRPAVDANFSQVSLLLHGNGANGSTTIVDSSSTNKTPTATFGNAQNSTDRSKFGSASLKFDGSGDAILYPHTADLHLSGDFTIEAWFYPLTSAHGMLLCKGGGLNIAWASYELCMEGLGAGTLNFVASSANAGYDIGSETGSTGSLGTPTLNAWNHVAVTRTGNVYRGFLNGVQGYTQTLALTPYDSSPRGLMVGGNFANTWGSGTPTASLNGYLDDVRITKGYARYQANFEPPTTPFYDPTSTPSVNQQAAPTTQASTLAASAAITTAGSDDPYYLQRALGLHMDGANGGTSFTDESQYAHVVTPEACTSSTTQAKFGATSAFYANGAASPKLTVAHAAELSPAGDFTISVWFYVPTTTGAIRNIITKSISSGHTPYALRITASGTLQCYASDTAGASLPINFTGGTVLTPSAWNHAALTRSGNTYRLFLNGSLQGSATYSGAGYSNASHPVVIGNVTDNSYPLGANGNAFIDDLYLYNGVALWTANFTPPTAPFNGGSQLAASTMQVATLAAPAAGFVANQTAAVTTQAATLAARAAVSAAQTAASTTQTATLAARATISAAQTAGATSQVATLDRPGASSITANQAAQGTSQVATLVSRMVVQAAQQAEATSQAATLAVRALLAAAQTAEPTTQAATLVRPAQGIVADQVAQPTSQTATLTARAAMQAQQVAQATQQVATLLALATISANQLAQPTTQAARLALNFDFERSPRTMDWPDGDRMLVRADDEDSADRTLTQRDFERTLVWPEQDRTLIAIGD